MMSGDPSTEIAGLRDQMGAVQRLSGAAASGTEDLLQQLALELGPGGQALLVDRLSSVMAASPRDAAEHVTALNGALKELWQRGTVGALVTQLGEAPVFLQTVGEPETGVILAAISPADDLTETVAVAKVAASLAAVMINAAARLRGAEDRLHNAVLQLLLNGETGKASQAMPGGLPAEPIRVYRISAPRPARGALRHQLWRIQAHHREPAVVTQVRDEIVVCARDDPRPADLYRDHLVGLQKQNVRAGISDPAPFDAIASAHQEAGHALRAAHASGTTLMSFSGLAEQRLLRLIPRQELLPWAATLLRPVTEADDSQRSLRRTLQIWLECHGGISQTSTILKVAPQTIRRRIVRIARLLQGDLDDECVRVRLYLAMHVLDQADQPVQYGPPLDVGKDCLVWLLDIRESTSWAASVIKPLREADPDGRLRHTVHIWLALHGELGETAARLGIHRNTLRKRLARAETILGVPLSWIGNRAQLYLALLTDDLAVQGMLPPEAHTHTR